MLPGTPCHAELSLSIYLKRSLRSNAFGDVANAHCEIKTSFISLAQSQHSLSFRMNCVKIQIKIK